MQLSAQILGMMYRALDLQLCTGYSLQHATLFTLEDCDGLIPGINTHGERLLYLHIEPRHCNLGLCNFPGRDESVCNSSEAEHRSRFDFNMIPGCLRKYMGVWYSVFVSVMCGLIDVSWWVPYVVAHDQSESSQPFCSPYA